MRYIVLSFILFSCASPVSDYSVKVESPQTKTTKPPRIVEGKIKKKRIDLGTDRIVFIDFEKLMREQSEDENADSTKDKCAKE